MDPLTLPYNLRSGLTCLIFLIGAGAGIFLILRKQTLTGGLALAGFVLFSIDPLVEVILFRLLGDNFSENYEILGWVYAGVSSVVTILGVAALTAALIMATRPHTSAHPPTPPTA